MATTNHESHASEYGYIQPARKKNRLRVEVKKSFRNPSSKIGYKSELCKFYRKRIWLIYRFFYGIYQIKHGFKEQQGMRRMSYLYRKIYDNGKTNAK